MSAYLGIDTSNYTTSAALFVDGTVIQRKQLLPVKEGELGLRQSDAVFHHVRQLPDIIESLYADAALSPCAVAASDRPQQEEGSYMPCFLVGTGLARQVAAVSHIPCHLFTHQQGHVMAALYGADCLSWRRAPFLAFHVSGGTTDALLVQPDVDCVIRCRRVGRSLDLKAGQLIDRVGGMLGLPFPAGPALERLALTSTAAFRIKTSVVGCDCHLSGVENQCRRMIDGGELPADVALFCLESVKAAVSAMTEALLAQYGKLPLVYAGGVMSNGILKAALTERFDGRFAPPVYSADNAAGIAVLCAVKEGAL